MQHYHFPQTKHKCLGLSHPLTSLNMGVMLREIKLHKYTIILNANVA